MANPTPPSSPLGGSSYATPKTKITIRSHSMMTPPDSPQSVRSCAVTDTARSVDLPEPLMSPFTSQQLAQTGILGEGQWSSVRRCSTGKAVYAVKCPKGRHAYRVLQHEACILTHLADSHDYTEHVVAFHGYDADEGSILLGCVALSLEDWIHSNGSVAKVPSSPNDLGLRALTQQLVAGLEFLQRHGIVHGDVKPGNILLDVVPGAQGFRALYCDFSAARLVGADVAPGDAAGTYDFMAPELYSLATEDSAPTFASDVYALGITVIHSGLGESPYSACPNAYLRRALAMRGEVLSVTPRAAWWEKLVVGAVCKSKEERWNVTEWLQVLERLE